MAIAALFAMAQAPLASEAAGENGAMQWDDPKVKEAMKLFAKMQNYVNPEHSAQSWDQAIKARNNF